MQQRTSAVKTKIETAMQDTEAHVKINYNIYYTYESITSYLNMNKYDINLYNSY